MSSCCLTWPSRFNLWLYLLLAGLTCVLTLFKQSRSRFPHFWCLYIIPTPWGGGSGLGSLSRGAAGPWRAGLILMMSPITPLFMCLVSNQCSFSVELLGPMCIYAFVDIRSPQWALVETILNKHSYISWAITKWSIECRLHDLTHLANLHSICFL